MRKKELPKRPAPSEFKEATERLAPYDQRVFAAYVVDSGFVRPQGAPVRWYFPIAARGAISEFAAVTPGSERDALRFIRRWGLLGWYGIKHGDGGGADSGGDPIVWVWTHAHGVRVALDLCRLLRHGDEMAIEDYIDSLRVTERQAEAAIQLGGLLKQADPYIELDSGVKADIISLGRLAFGASAGGEDYGLILGRREGLAVLRPSANPGEPFASIARRLVANIINPHLRGVFPALAYEFNDHHNGVLTLQRQYRFDSLVSMIYHHIADVAVGGRVVICQECGLPFVQTDRRQQFCPKPPGARESHCAARFHQREYRKRNPKPKRERQ
jgi:hypothetical protein